MTKITFNKSNIESIETPLKRSLVYSDEIKGLHLETFKSGTKTFRLAYKLNNFRYVYTIGQFPSLHPSYAIKKAKELKQLVSEGKNPQLDKALNRKEPTFKEYFIEEYIPLKVSHYFQYSQAKIKISEEKTDQEINRLRFDIKVSKAASGLLQWWNANLRTHSIINKRMIDISPLDINSLFNELSKTKKVSANATIKQLRNMFDFHSPNKNPVKQGLKKYFKMNKVNKRLRKATSEELIRLGGALDKLDKGYLMDNGYYYQPQLIQVVALKVILFEGMRPIEIFSMKWDQIKGKEYMTDSKTGVIKTILTNKTLELINKLPRDSEFVFPTKKHLRINHGDNHLKSVRKVWIKACALANITDLEIYDLRKTFSSMASKKFGTFESSKLTNHANSKIVEDHYSFLDSGELEAKKNEVSTTFNNLINGGGKVVNIG